MSTSSPLLRPRPTLGTAAALTRRRFRFGRLTLAVALIGVLLTLTGFFAFRSRDRAGRYLRFEQEAMQLAASCLLHFQMPLESLRSLASFFAVTEEVTRAEFAAYVQPTLDYWPQIYCFEWMPLVRGEDRAAVEARARQEGLAGFTVTEKDSSGAVVPAPHRTEHLPILFMEPPHRLALGLDAVASADPVRSGPPRRARQEGRLSASGPFRLVEDPEGMLSVIVYAPVHQDSAGGDRGAFEGLAAVIMRLGPTVARARQVVGDPALDMALLDVTEPDQVQVVHAEGPEMAAFAVRWADREIPTLPRHGPFVWARELPFADRTWKMVVRPGAGSPFGADRLPWAGLIGGLVLTALLTWSVGLFQTILRLRRQVDAALELGQYTLGRKLGEGGMGLVYEAQHRMLARPAAIKLIRPENLGPGPAGSSGSSGLLARFETEAKATARLQSPHTISVYDFGRTEAGEFYYVMELLEGLDLESLVQRFGPVPPARAVFLLRQVCQSLAEAHRAGLTHRDIKPANIYTCRKGLQHDFVKVLDFGLVKGGEEIEEGKTRQGVILGTPGYLSPEMVLGRPVDGRSDLYSLGCVAYWLLTGTLVFEGDGALAVAMSHVTETPTPPSARSEVEIPPDLEALILRLLEKKPEDRPADALEVDRLLAAAQPAPPWDEDRAARWWHRHLPRPGGAGAESPPVGSPVRTILLDTEPRD